MQQLWYISRRFGQLKKQFMEPMVNIAVKAARAAGEMMTNAFARLDRVKVSEKQPNDFVTDIDLQSEQIIMDTILYNYSDHGIIAEESGKLNEGADVVWIIDPLDGTRNFMHGFPHFAISIGVQIEGKMAHGLIYDPIRQEFFSASKGRGARCNNQRIRVGQCRKIESALVGTGFANSKTHDLDTSLDAFNHVIHKASSIRRTGSAALDLAYVAAGRMDAFWEYGLHSWDIAAGSVIIKEAGGLVSDEKGGENYLKTGNVVTANPKLLKEMVTIIR